MPFLTAHFDFFHFNRSQMKNFVDGPDDERTKLFPTSFISENEGNWRLCSILLANIFYFYCQSIDVYLRSRKKEEKIVYLSVSPSPTPNDKIYPV